MSMLATSASCGSLGSGVLRSDCKERRADLIVRTGDQAVPRVSRQIAPYNMLTIRISVTGDTYSLTADIWMPQLCLEKHLRRPKGVFLRNFDVYYICTAFIGRIWRTWKRRM
jgi:hypothetical protein